jgi:hypothetical protein
MLAVAAVRHIAHLKRTMTISLSQVAHRDTRRSGPYALPVVANVVYRAIGMRVGDFAGEAQEAIDMSGCSIARPQRG